MGRGVSITSNSPIIIFTYITAVILPSDLVKMVSLFLKFITHKGFNKNCIQITLKVRESLKSIINVVFIIHRQGIDGFILHTAPAPSSTNIQMRRSFMQACLTSISFGLADSKEKCSNDKYDLRDKEQVDSTYI